MASTPSAQARLTVGSALSSPGILSQPPFSITVDLSQELVAFNSLTLSWYLGPLANCATQIAARVESTAASTFASDLLPVTQPPQLKPMIIAPTAPRISPQAPYFAFISVSGGIPPLFPSRGAPSVRQRTYAAESASSGPGKELVEHLLADRRGREDQVMPASRESEHRDAAAERARPARYVLPVEHDVALVAVHRQHRNFE